VSVTRWQVSLQFMVTAPTVQIASLGMWDSLIIMVIALVVFGPRRLPQIGRQIGKLMYEFRKASNDFKFQMEEELRNAEESDRRKKEEERLRALALAAPAATPAPTPSETSTAVETTGTGTAGTEAAATEAAAAETPYPAASYDNGPVASTQAADSAPTIVPPSIGETVAAARGWSEKYEQARLAEASKPVGAPALSAAESSTESATKSSAPESAASEPVPSSRAGSESAPAEAIATAPVPSTSDLPENASSEAGSAEPGPVAAAQAAGIAVNHHG
jgi:sec-independent protein translocase protein TatB